MMNEEEVKKSIPLLKEFIEKTSGNGYLSGIMHDAKYLLDVAERSVKFGIYNESQSLGYGMGIYTMKNIYDDRFKGPEELLKISFPTGAYIFGEHYDKEYFMEFWRGKFFRTHWSYCSIKQSLCSCH